MSEPNFLRLLQGHVGGLVRLRAGLKSPVEFDSWDGRVCLLLEVISAATEGGARARRTGAVVDLFVDGRGVRLWLMQDEIELIGGDDV